MAVTVIQPIYGTGVYGTAVYGTYVVRGLDTVSAAGSIGTIQVNISEKVTAVSANGAIAPVQVGGFEIDITERVDTGVSAEGNIGTVEVQVKEEVQQDDTVSADVAIGIVTPHASSKIIPDSVSTIGVVTTVEEQVKEEISASLSAVGNVGTVEVQITEKLASVSAEGNIGVPTFKINSLAKPDGDAATLAVVSEETEPQVQEPLDISLAADVGFNGDNIKLYITEFVPAVPTNAALGDITVTAEQFNFENVKTLYSRRRTVIISRAA
jgi:hypothetical protein